MASDSGDQTTSYMALLSFLFIFRFLVDGQFITLKRNICLVLVVFCGGIPPSSSLMYTHSIRHFMTLAPAIDRLIITPPSPLSVSLLGS